MTQEQYANFQIVGLFLYAIALFGLERPHRYVVAIPIVSIQAFAAFMQGMETSTTLYVMCIIMNLLSYHGSTRYSGQNQKN
jgi:hypothetical protein